MTIRTIDETFRRKMLRTDDDNQVFGLRMSADTAHALMDLLDIKGLPELDPEDFLAYALDKAAGDTKTTNEAHYIVLRVEP